MERLAFYFFNVGSKFFYLSLVLFQNGPNHSFDTATITPAYNNFSRICKIADEHNVNLTFEMAQWFFLLITSMMPAELKSWITFLHRVPRFGGRFHNLLYSGKIWDFSCPEFGDLWHLSYCSIIRASSSIAFLRLNLGTRTFKAPGIHSMETVPPKLNNVT